MTFVEAQVEYCRIKSQLKSNNISYDEYVERINGLRLQDDKGNWYQINAADGSWLLWDGHAWICSSLPEIIRKHEAAFRGKVSESVSKSEHEPETLWKLFVSIVKGFFRNIPKTVLFHLIKLAAVFLVVFIIHAYLLVVKNEGFAVDWNNPYAAITNLDGVNYSVSAFWAFFTFFLTILLTRIIKGPIKFIKEIVTTPVYLFNNFKGSGQAGLMALLVAMALGLLSSMVIKNPYLLVLYALMIIFSLTKQRKGLLLLVIKLAWQDWHRIINTRKAGQKPNIGTMSIFVLGIPIGLFIVYILPLKPYSPIILAILLLALCVLLKTKKVSPSAAMLILAFFAFNVVFFRCREVFADDGGWREAGGTLKGYVNSPGAGKAVADGLGPSAAAAGGSLAGSFVPEVEVPGEDAGTKETDQENGMNPDDPEGTIVHENPDGSIVKEYPDGTIVVKYPDGTIEEAGNDGLPEVIILIPEDTFGGPEDNPFTIFEGDNPCN